ncbi:MAG: tetratricopeptide repeat protein [Trueperaceae bacterium]
MDRSLRLLGVPLCLGTEEPLELPPGQATHLAAVLAIRGDWVARDELAALFWPDVEPRRGRHNLAQLLYAMRRAPWGEGVEAEPSRVRWQVATDVAAFRRAASDGAWAAAAERYAGDLLEGVTEPSSPPLAEWLRAEREDLRETWTEALQGRADALAAGGHWQECARLLRRLLASDSLLEGAVQGLIRAEAMTGRRDAALQVYTEFRQRLGHELGLEPLEATAELASAVRSGALVAAGAVASPLEEPTTEPDVRPGPVRGLAADATPFVGRALELAELHGLLRGGAHRLVTVRGPGGTGKTRVARQLARERSGHHADGAAWVPLEGAVSEVDAVDAIARVMGLRVDLDASALAGALADRDLLLVLDQVEHLPDAAGLALALLDTAPAVRMVVTSRAPLEVPGEAVVALAGLAVPPRDDAEDAEAFDSVALLLRAARRARPDCHPVGAERTALVALARLLDGNPLGLELAASWLRLLEPSELLAEVRRDLDVLRDVRSGGGRGAGRDGSRDALPAGGADIDPSRSSLRAVFESSWSLLGESERESLRRLGVFRGGCTRETATAVADVPLATVLALTNRSLLQRQGTTRFVTHPVVQQFVEEKLAEQPALADELERRHAAYFLASAEDADRRLDTPEQKPALARLAGEGPNVMAALERAIAAERVEEAHALTAALGRLWRWHGRTREGLAWSERVRALPWSGDPTPARVRARLAEGLLLEKTGRYEDADRAFQDGLDDAERLGDAALVTAARVDQAIVAWRRGNLAEARTLLEEVCASYRELGREPQLAGALGNLGNVARDAGDLDAAHACFDEALEIVERIGHVWEIANVRNNKAIAHAYGRDLDAARVEFEHALELQRSIDNLPGISMSLTNLGNVHLDTGDLKRAEELYRESLALCEEIGDVDGIAHTSVNLGILAQWAGDFEASHAYYADALRKRRELGARALVAQSVSCFMDLAAARGAHERALVLAGAVRSLVERVGVPLTAPQRSVYDEALEKARDAVAADRAAELERRGSDLSEPEAVDFALGTRAAP